MRRARIGSKLLPVLAAAALLCACGESPTPVGKLAREQIQQDSAAIMGGEVDGDTKGAIGLARNVLDLYFFGHCSGSLIAPNVVLTAQHCVSIIEDENQAGGVVCGQTDFGATASGQALRVTVETVRPQVDGPAFYKGTGPVRAAPGTDNLCGFDVALLILEGKGIGATVATPLVPRIDGPPAIGDSYSAVGYGLTAPEGGSSGTRMRIDGNEVTCLGEDCGAKSSVKSSEWRGTAPTCKGDSGGPAIDSEGRVMGVLSRGPTGCLSSVYGNVSAWKQFLIDTTLEAAELAEIDPPYWAVTGTSVPPEPAQPNEDCIGVCVEGYACARSAGERICVPSCASESDDSCPKGSSCDLHTGGCVRPIPVATEEVDDDGCSLSNSPGSSDSSRISLLLLGLAWLLGRRHRAA